jgi:hypothetical protein
MTINHIPTSWQKLFSAKFVAKATIAAATGLTAAGSLIVPAPAQAGPMLPLPLAPPCSQFNFYTGDWPVTVVGVGSPQVIQTHHGPTAAGRVLTNGAYQGSVTSGGIYGRNVDFTITFGNNLRRHYTGMVGDDGLVSNGVASDENGGNPVPWLTGNPLVCIDAPPPAAPDAQTAAARLGVSVNGPTTLPAGQSGTYTVNVSNSGDVGAPVELYVSYSGNLQQTGQVTPSGGFNCDVLNYAGGTSSVHCTVGQFGPKATETIVVQGRGSAPGAGGLGVNINSSDPAAQFVQKSQKLNVTIT